MTAWFNSPTERIQVSIQFTMPNSSRVSGLARWSAASESNIALVQRAEDAGLLPPGVKRDAASAYRQLRHVQHRARLNEGPTQVKSSVLQDEQSAIYAL